MNAIGPVVLFNNNQPTSWYYFDLTDSNKVACYQMPYPATDKAEWMISSLNEKTPHYCYDPEHQKGICFVLDGGNLYRVPLSKMGTEQLVNQVQNAHLTDSEITWRLAKKRASELGVDARLFPVTINMNTPTPKITQTTTALEPKKTTYPTVDISKARDLLQIHHVTRVEEASQCPETLTDGQLYAWQDNQQWHFIASLSGESKTGAFHPQQDKDAIAMLKQVVINTPKAIQGLDAMKMTRPFIGLTPEQQARVINTISFDWPLSSEFSTQEQIQLCRSIIQGEVLTQNANVQANIHAFRPYLFPSTINQLFQQNFYADNKDKATIADVMLYIKHLLAASARQLGDTQALIIQEPSTSFKIKCGELPNADKSLSLIYQGMNEQNSDLFQLILTYESNGLAEMSKEQILELKEQLEGLSNPQHHQHHMDVASNILAAISTAQGISQDQAKTKLDDLCRTILEKINPISILINLLEQAGLLSGENAQANFNALVNSKDLYSLANAFERLQSTTLLSGQNAQMNCNALVNSKDPDLLANVFERLQSTTLLSGQNAQANFDALVNNKALYWLATTFKRPQSMTLLSGQNAQLYFNALVNSKDPFALADAFKRLQSTTLLSGQNAQLYFDALANSERPDLLTNVFERLQSTTLLSGQNAQANVNALVNSKKPYWLAKAFKYLQSTTLLSGQNAQANFNALVNSENPFALADAFRRLQSTTLLSGQNVQLYFDALVNSKDPNEFANKLIRSQDALTILQDAKLLCGEHAQTHLNTVLNSYSPIHRAQQMKNTHVATKTISALLFTTITHRFKKEVRDINPHSNLTDAQLKQIDDLIHTLNQELETSISHEIKMITINDLDALKAFKTLSKTMDVSNAILEIKNDVQFQHIKKDSRTYALMESIRDEGLNLNQLGSTP